MSTANTFQPAAAATWVPSIGPDLSSTTPQIGGGGGGGGGVYYPPIAVPGDAVPTAAADGMLKRHRLGKSFSRSEAISFCAQAGGRLAYHCEIVDVATRGLLINGGKPLKGEHWTPVLDGVPANDLDGMGWVQVGNDSGRMGLSHWQALGCDTTYDSGWGGVGKRKWKGPYVYYVVPADSAQARAPRRTDNHHKKDLQQGLLGKQERATSGSGKKSRNWLKRVIRQRLKRGSY
eukprot:COSAG01_NODE_11499_length_1920_cov_130.990115_2_plen_233_part_00